MSLGKNNYIVVEKTESDRLHAQRVRMVIIGAIVAVITVIVATVLILVDRAKTATIVVNVAPASSDIRIGGKKYNNGEHRIRPGTYSVEISKDGFEGYSSEITVSDGDAEAIYVCLSQIGDSNWYRDNPEDERLCYAVEEHDYSVAEDKLLSDPIYKWVPYHGYDDGFYIDPVQNEDGKITLSVTLLSCKEERREGLKDNMFEWLQKRGIDTDKYEFEYKNGCDPEEFQ